AAYYLAGTVLTTLFGAGFVVATETLHVLLLALFVNLIAGQYRTALVALGRQRQDLGAVAASALVHVAAKLVLIPLFAIAATECGTLLGELILMLAAMSLVLSAFRESSDCK